MIKVSAYIRKYWYMYAAALVCMILQVGLDMLSPQVTARLIDDVLGKRQAELLPKLLAADFCHWSRKGRVWLPERIYF